MTCFTSQTLISKAQFTVGLKFIKCLMLSANQHCHLLKIKRKKIEEARASNKP